MLIKVLATVVCELKGKDKDIVLEEIYFYRDDSRRGMYQDLARLNRCTICRPPQARVGEGIWGEDIH